MNPGFYRRMFNTTRELTIRAVECIPDVNFKPPHSRSCAEIVLHVVESEYRILNGFTGRQDEPQKPLTLANYGTRAALVELLRARQKSTVALLEKVDTQALERITRSPMDGDAPGAEWLTILLLHEVDHKGSLVMLAKTLGGDAPDVVALDEEGWAG